MMPKCCGKNMSIYIETSRFYEVHCSECGDNVYVKKDALEIPQMLDD